MQVSWGSASANSRHTSPTGGAATTLAQRHTRHSKPVGLVNLGNTCFLNAAIQALAHTPLLAPFFLQGHFVRDLNAANPLGTQGALAMAFAELLRKLFPSEEGKKGTERLCGQPMAPRDYYDAVCNAFPLIGEQRGAQQDAHEVLSYVLDALHEDLNRVKRPPPYVERKDLDEEALSRKGEERYAAEAWRDHLHRHRSVVVDLCQGQLRSQVRCCECGCSSVTFDPFLFLSLPLPPGLRRGCSKSIQAAIQQFCTEERLVGTDSWGCPKCKRRVNAMKCLQLWKLPVLLFVHLKRFGFEAPRGYSSAPRAWKIEGEVSLPLTKLDLHGFVAENSPQRVPLLYDLFAAVDHVGASPHLGHYTAACRRADGWWRFDDSRAEFLGEGARVIGDGNYLLLFQRRDAPLEPEQVKEQSHDMPENWPHFKRDGVEWSFLQGDGTSSQHSDV